MRSALIGVVFTLLASCGNKVDHPDAAPGCDPAVMNCSYTPEMGSVGLGEGGESSGGDQIADWSGQLLAFQDDYFDLGSVFTGTAEVSATGVSGARVKGDYDGSIFHLEDVVKTASNWFLVDPDVGQGVVPTLTVVDTRSVDADALDIGVAHQQDVESIFQLSLAGEPSRDRAQIVLKVVDEQQRSVSGVTAQLMAEIVAYRQESTWDAAEGGATDDSGMIFLGNVPATAALSPVNVNLGGAVTARIEVRILAGAISIVTATVSP
jgi:hypothetical protein